MNCFECEQAIQGEPIWFTPWNPEGKRVPRIYHETCLPSVFGGKRPLGIGDNEGPAPRKKGVLVSDGCTHTRGGPASTDWSDDQTWEPKFGSRARRQY